MKKSELPQKVGRPKLKFSSLAQPKNKKRWSEFTFRDRWRRLLRKEKRAGG